MPDDTQKWSSAGIGIATLATILAAATSAGVFAIAGRQESYPEWARGISALLATISLLAYLVVVVFSLAALFRETHSAKRAQIVLAAGAVFVQVYTAVFAVLLVIYSQLFQRIGG